jgi:glycoprotein endo-alpha-1,2-mannosidase
MDGLAAIRARAAVRYERVARQVLAFYYGWYGNPQVSGRWVHWEQVDPERQQIANSTHYPLLGAYDSHDPQVMRQHCQWAREAGLDGFIVSWWGQGDFYERSLPRLLDTAHQHHLHITIYYEVVPTPGDPESVVQDWLYLLRQYSAHPAWLKVEGKPVIFVYGRALGQLRLPQWAMVLEQVREKHKAGICAIADQLSRTAARIFDGIHTYNICGELEGKPLEEVQAEVERIYREPLQVASQFGRIACATIIPGYDDKKIRKPGIRTERRDGELYKRQWAAVLALNPDWVLITSFNEWHEGSEIEPSVEHGDRYLKLTAEYVPRFRQLPERPRIATPLTAITGEKMSALRRRWQNKRIAILPDAESDALFWLLESGLEVVPLAYNELVKPGELTPSRYAALVYLGGEHYRATVSEANDVSRALRAYLQAGGTLVALPSAPFPFYYDGERAVRHAPLLGLPIAESSPVPMPGQSGFERPPEGLRFHFRCDRRRLPDMPAQLPFPEGGDRRWRPILTTLAPAPHDYTPLITLFDSSGRSWGEGTAIVRYRAGELKGATLAYVWFRLLEMPQAPALLHNLFMLLGARRR